MCAKNVCRAYEFANLFEEPRLAERCLQIICTKTEDILADPSFEEIELSTLHKILDQEFLHIESELDLFMALTRYADKHDYGKPICKYFVNESCVLLCCRALINNLVSFAAKEEEEEQLQRSIAGEGPSNRIAISPPPPPQAPSSVDMVVAAPPIAIVEPQRQPQQPRNENQPQTFRDAVKKIRFLTLNPKQFAENVAKSNILNQAEAFAILMNISSQTPDLYPMPDGFSSSTKSRSMVEPSTSTANVAGTSGSSSNWPNDGNVEPIRPPPPFFGFGEDEVREIREQHCLNIAPVRESTPRNMMETRRFYCVRTIRQQIDYFNTSVSDCSLTFTVDRSICITGIQVPTQVLGEQSLHAGNLPDRYSELLYAHLLDSQGSRLTYTHCTTKVRFDSLLEISFDRPVYIQRTKIYKIGVAFNKIGWYPMCTCVPLISCENVCFAFNVGAVNESVRDGLIRAIVFTLPRDNMYS